MSVLRVDTDALGGFVAAVRAAQGEARALTRSPGAMRELFTVAGAGAGSCDLAGAGAAFVSAWAEALDDAAHQLDWLASAVEVTRQAYQVVEDAVTRSTVTGSRDAAG